MNVKTQEYVYEDKNIDGTRAYNYPCLYGKKCLDISCKYYHPETMCENGLMCPSLLNAEIKCKKRHCLSEESPLLPRSLECIYGKDCNDINCQKLHPVPLCMYGTYCKNDTCEFRHVVINKKK